MRWRCSSLTRVPPSRLPCRLLRSSAASRATVRCPLLTLCPSICWSFAPCDTCARYLPSFSFLLLSFTLVAGESKCRKSLLKVTCLLAVVRVAATLAVDCKAAHGPLPKGDRVPHEHFTVVAWAAAISLRADALPLVDGALMATSEDVTVSALIVGYARFSFFFALVSPYH